MTRFNYRIHEDPSFPVGVDNHFPGRRRQMIAANASTASFATEGLSQAAISNNTVTQATDKSTGVTLSRLHGVITMNGAALGAGAEATFIVTNTLVGASDVPVVAHASAGTSGAYLVGVSAVAAGTFSLTVTNVSAGSLSEAIVLNFIVHKAASLPLEGQVIVGSGSVASGDAATNGPAVVAITGSAGSGDSCAMMTPFTQVRRDWDPDISFKIVTGTNATTVRWWVGMFSGDPSAVDTLAGLSAAAFGYDTTADTTVFWRCKVGDTGTQTSFTTDVAVVASTVYYMRIRYNPDTAAMEFYISSGNRTQPKLVTSLSTNLPVATTLLGYGATVTTLAAAARRLSVCRMNAYMN